MRYDLTDGAWYVKTRELNFHVVILNGMVVDCSDVMRRFRGQPSDSISRWLRGVKGHIELTKI